MLGRLAALSFVVALAAPPRATAAPTRGGAHGSRGASASARPGAARGATDARPRPAQRAPRRAEKPEARVDVRELVRIELPSFGPARVVEEREHRGAFAAAPREAFRAASGERLREAAAGHAARHYRGEGAELTARGLDGGDGEAFTTVLEVPRALHFVTQWSDARLVLADVGLFDWLPLPGADAGMADAGMGDAGTVDAGAVDAGTPAADGGLAPLGGASLAALPVVERTFAVALPRGFVVDTLPDDRTRELGPALWTARFSSSEGAVQAVFRFEPRASALSPQEGQALRRAVEALAQEERPVVTLKHEALALVAKDRAVEGVEALRALLARAPTDAYNRARLATALLELGLGGPARAEAARAVRDAPDDAVVATTQGFVATHDLLGRQHAPGADRPLALMSLELAVARDPRATFARRELARMLERDANGDLVWSGSELTEAVRHYEALVVEHRDLSALGPLVEALWRLRRYDAVVELTSKLEGAGVGERGVAALAVHKGAQAARARAKALWPSGDERGAHLFEVLRLLVGAREYDVARSLIDLSRSELSDEAKAIAPLVAKLRPVATVVDLKTPESAMRSYLALPLLAETSSGFLDRLEAMFAAPLRSTFAAERRRRGSDAAVAGRLGFEPGRGPTAALTTDALLAAATLRVEGSEAAGFRVRAYGTVGERTVDLRVYFVREERELRIAAFEGAVGALGGWLLELAERGRLDAAKLWASWAAAAVPEGRAAHVLGFHQVWPPRAGDDELRALRLAGALLAVGDRAFFPRALAILDAEAAASDGTRRTKLLRAIGYGALGAGKAQVAVRAFSEVVGQDDESEDLAAYVAACLDAGLLDEAARRLEGQLRRTPSSPKWRELATRLASKQRRFDRALAHQEALLDERPRDAAVLNNTAWYRLLAGRIDDETERLAARAVELSGDDALAALHTLALVQLERGKLRAGVASLRGRLQRLPAGELEGADWYVVGRLAELLGYADEARACYARISDDDDDEETRVLRERRLLPAQRRGR